MRKLKIIKLIAYTLAITIGMIVMFYLGIFYEKIYGFNYNISVIKDDQMDIMYSYDRFCDLSRIFVKYLSDNDGIVPIDPYKTLVESKYVRNTYEFMVYGKFIMFDQMELPPRINKDMSKNIKMPMFWLDMFEINEIWVCYFDGTCERYASKSNNLSDISTFGGKQLHWSRLFHKVGYPYWGSLDEKEKWFSKNANKLIWNNDLGLYVPIK